MKRIVAVILLLLYVAFTGAVSLTAHSCSDQCSNSAAHTDFDEHEFPLPSGCAEKEIFLSSGIEHRSGAVLKVADKGVSDNYTLRSGKDFTPRKTKTGTPVTDFLHVKSSTPIYLRDCAFLL